MARERTESAMCKQAKRAGMSKKEYVKRRSAAITSSARAQGWRPSETAMALADIIELAEKIYGPDSEQPRDLDSDLQEDR